MGLEIRLVGGKVLDVMTISDRHPHDKMSKARQGKRSLSAIRKEVASCVESRDLDCQLR